MEYADFSWYKGALPWLRQRTIFVTKTGSHSYGTNLPGSDVDLKGVCIPPKEYYLGNLNRFEQADKQGEIDYTIYGINKFFDLAADCNPNIIEVLFTDKADWIATPECVRAWDGYGFATSPWGRIWNQREMFLSQKAQHTFSGYAVSQLRKIETHRHWLLNPPKRQPVREDFGLMANERNIDKEQLGVINARIRKMEDQLGGKGFTADQVELQEDVMIDTVVTEGNLSRDLIKIIKAERKYAAAMRNWDSFLRWKNGRNPKRAELEAKFGYDTKHAMHLVRLLFMAEEILARGEVVVRRPDFQMLLDIRAGKYPYEDVVDFARWKEVGLQFVTSPLPHDPPRVKIDELLMDTIERYNWGRR